MNASTNHTIGSCTTYFTPKEESQIVVSWHIRNTEKLLRKQIPSEIVKLCWSFYHLFEICSIPGLNERDFYKTYWIEAGKIGPGWNCVYSSINRIRWITRKTDKKQFALFMTKMTAKKLTDTESWKKSIILLQKFKYCPNIIDLLNWCESRKRIYIVVEAADKGTIFGEITKNKDFNELDVINIIKQIVNGLKHIHSEKYVHCNLNPYNLRFCNNILKIDSFISCGDCIDNDWLLNIPYNTLVTYSSPEMIEIAQLLTNDNTENIENTNIGYNMSTDIWSLGVIMYVLLGGYLPFDTIEDDKEILFECIKKGDYSFHCDSNWNNISDEAKDLIKKLLVIDKNKRLNAKQILQHPWIVNKCTKNVVFGANYMNKLSKFKSNTCFHSMFKTF